MRSRSLAASILALVLAAVSAAADTSPQAYRAALTGALATARRAASAAPPQSDALLRQARRRLPVEVAVTGADRLPIAVSNQLLARLLDRALATRTPTARWRAIDRFARRVETLLSALEPRPATRSAAEAQVLQRVLRRSEFGPSAIEEWERGVREWLQSFLRRLFGDVQPATIDFVARAIYDLFLALLVLLLAYLIWTYAPGLRLRRRGRVSHLGSENVVTAPERADAYLAQAEGAARAGRYLEALRHTYVAMLLLLDAADRVSYDPSRTNWELLRALRGATHAPVRELLLPVTRLIDEKLYGGRPVSEGDYHGCRDACARLKGLLVS